MRNFQRPRQRPNLQAGIEVRKHRPDYWLVMLATALLAIGLVVVYAISPGVSERAGVSESYHVSKQLLAIGLGITAFIVISRIPYQWWRKMVRPMIILSIIVALAVQLFGNKVNGAYRWIQIGGMSFQAAELIKFTLLIGLADFLARRRQENLIGDFNRTIKPLLIILGVIAVVVGFFESDFGSTTVMIAMASSIMFIVGVPLKRLAMLLGVFMVAAVLLISAMPYRRQRLLTYLHPASDCQTAGYQSCQALIAVGSGGMFGLGLGKSVQAYGYLPFAENDSIFAILSEKFGFVGVTIILGLYLIFFARLAKTAEKATDDFSRLVIVGMLAWFSVQSIINIGAMIGILPLKGITLPFISYGGTSLLFVTGALGIAFQISRYSHLGKFEPERRATSENSTYWRR